MYCGSPSTCATSPLPSSTMKGMQRCSLGTLCKVFATYLLSHALAPTTFHGRMVDAVEPKAQQRNKRADDACDPRHDGNADDEPRVDHALTPERRSATVTP